MPDGWAVVKGGAEQIGYLRISENKFQTERPIGVAPTEGEDGNIPPWSEWLKHEARSSEKITWIHDLTGELWIEGTNPVGTHKNGPEKEGKSKNT